jgi:hypothetical protein
MQSPNNSKKGAQGKNIKSNPSSPNSALKNEKNFSQASNSSSSNGILVAIGSTGLGSKSRGKGRVYLNPKTMRDLRLSVEDAVTIRAVTLSALASSSSSSTTSLASSLNVNSNSASRVAVVNVWPAEVKIGRMAVLLLLLLSVC